MIAEFNGKISEDVRHFYIKIARAALCQWALDEVVQAQMEVVVAQVVEQSALVEAELAADGKIDPI